MNGVNLIEYHNLQLATTNLSPNSNAASNLEVRYVFDIGSGGTKSKAVLVDKNTNKLIVTIAEASIGMPYQKCISDSEDGKTLPHSCMNDGLTSLLKIVNAYGFQSTKDMKCASIATAWARNALNGNDYIDLLNEYGFNVKVVSQEEEGLIGYKAAQMQLGRDIIGRTLVWDIGGGSFQLCLRDQLSQKLFVYEGGYGASNFNHEVMSIFKDEGRNGVFLTLEQLEKAKEFAHEKVTKPLQEFTNKNINVIDLSNGAFGIGQMMNLGMKSLVGRDKIDAKTVDSLIKEFATTHITGAANKYPDIHHEFLEQMQTNLLLIKAVMDGLNVMEVNFLNAKSLDYVALDPVYWTEDVAMHGNNDNGVLSHDLHLSSDYATHQAS